MAYGIAGKDWPNQSRGYEVAIPRRDNHKGGGVFHSSLPHLQLMSMQSLTPNGPVDIGDPVTISVKRADSRNSNGDIKIAVIKNVEAGVAVKGEHKTEVSFSRTAHAVLSLSGANTSTLEVNVKHDSAVEEVSLPGEFEFETLLKLDPSDTTFQGILQVMVHYSGGFSPRRKKSVSPFVLPHAQLSPCHRTWNLTVGCAENGVPHFSAKKVPDSMFFY